MTTLQALSCFADLTEPLDGATRTELLAAVGEVSLQSSPTMSASGEIGASPR